METSVLLLNGGEKEDINALKVISPMVDIRDEETSSSRDMDAEWTWILGLYEFPPC